MVRLSVQVVQVVRLLLLVHKIALMVQVVVRLYWQDRLLVQQLEVVVEELQQLQVEAGALQQQLEEQLEQEVEEVQLDLLSKMV